MFPLYREAERVQRDEWVKSRGSFSSSTILEKLKSLSSLRRLHGKLRSLCSLRRLHLAPLKNAGETASSTWGQFGALSTENEVGTGGILDGTRQDSSEEGKWSWHDEGRPRQLCISCQRRGRRQGGGQRNMSVSRSTVRKWSILELVRRRLEPSKWYTS